MDSCRPRPERCCGRNATRSDRTKLSRQAAHAFRLDELHVSKYPGSIPCEAMLRISAFIKQLLPSPSGATNQSPSRCNSMSRVGLSRHPTLVFCVATRRKRRVHAIMLASFMLPCTSRQPCHSPDQSLLATSWYRTSSTPTDTKQPCINSGSCPHVTGVEIGPPPWRRKHGTSIPVCNMQVIKDSQDPRVAHANADASCLQADMEASHVNCGPCGDLATCGRRGCLVLFAWARSMNTCCRSHCRFARNEGRAHGLLRGNSSRKATYRDPAGWWTLLRVTALKLLALGRDLKHLEPVSSKSAKVKLHAP